MNLEILNKINKGEVVAIIPARSGSKGIPGKNIRKLQGFPMIAYSIAAARMSSVIDRIIVSTDSEEYAAIARDYGAETPFLRPAELASDKSTDIDFMEHAINWLYENEGSVPEFFVHLRPTYPLRDVNIIDDAVMQLKNDPSADCLRSAHLTDATPYKWFQRTADGYYLPLFDNMTLDECNGPRQNYKVTYMPDGYVDVLRTECIVKNDVLHGKKMIGFVVDDGIDIDTLKEMEQIEQMVATSSMPLISWMNDNYGDLKETK